MNTENLKESIENIINCDENVETILVDGPWGVGKSYFIENNIESNKKIIMVSVFGKESVKSIENELLLKILSPKIFEKKFFRKGVELFGKAVENKTGIDFSILSGVASIDNLPQDVINSEKRIICFDDLERKSSSYDLRDIFGLIERVSLKFSTIIIANTAKLNKEDKKIYNDYKEKLIDVIFKMNHISDVTYNQIVQKIRLDRYHLNNKELIEVYKRDRYFGEARSNAKVSYPIENSINLRIFTKYVNLISRVENIISSDMGKQFDGLGTEYFKICKTVVEKKFSSDKNKVVCKGIDDSELYREIDKIYMHREFSIEVLRDFLINDNEIRNDIKTLWNLHTVSVSDYEELIGKITKAVKEKNLNYFVNQNQVISLVDVLSSLKITNFTQNLFDIAIMLYSKPEMDKPPRYNDEHWKDVDRYGNELDCNKWTKKFINRLNRNNEKVFFEVFSDCIENGISKDNSEYLKAILSYRKITNSNDFSNLFNYAVGRYLESYSEEDLSLLIKIVDKYEGDKAIKYIKRLKGNETVITTIKLYDYLIENLDYRLEMEYQAKTRAEYEE